MSSNLQTVKPTTDKLEHALQCAARGWAVFPLHTGDGDGRCSCGKANCSVGKHPRTKNGLKDATTNPVTITKWWTKWPDANIGVRTGKASGLWALGPDGPEGLADLQRLEAKNGALPRTARNRTGSGGQHLLFRYPADGKPVINRTNHRGTNIDTRGEGGYIVGAPGRNGNGVYKVIDATDPAEAPPWLLGWVRGAESKPAPPNRPADVPTGECERRAVAPPAGRIVAGGRNDRLTSLAGTMRRRGMGEEAIYAALDVENRNRCEPPLGDLEVRGIAKSVSRYLPAGSVPRVPSSAPATPQPDDSMTTANVIRAWLHGRYRPAFRRHGGIVTDDGEEVSRVDALAAPDSGLIARLADATDAPRYTPRQGQQVGDVKRDSLPGHFKKWAPVAWGDLIGSLPDEDAAELGADAPAGEEFRRLVRDALFSQIVLGDVIGDSKVTQTERCSVIDWCYKFAKTGPWKSIRSYRCWCKLDDLGGGEFKLKVAVRHELFAQLKADKRLSSMPANTFGRRAKRYGVGASSRDSRPEGQSAVVLADEFVAELLASCDADAREILVGPT